MSQVNNKKKNLSKIIKHTLFSFFKFLCTKTWLFTVLFFMVVLILAVSIWWQCVYRPEPSIAVMEKIEREKEDFDDMKKKTMDVITLLQAYRNNYDNAPKFENQRELFIDLLDPEVIEKLKVKTNEISEQEQSSVNEDEQQATQTEVLESLPTTEIDFKKVDSLNISTPNTTK